MFIRWQMQAVLALVLAIVGAALMVQHASGSATFLGAGLAAAGVATAVRAYRAYLLVCSGRERRS